MHTGEITQWFFVLVALDISLTQSPCRNAQQRSTGLVYRISTRGNIWNIDPSGGDCGFARGKGKGMLDT